jgi:phosphoglycolate phosphatase-like HAD superfamily hydrolase
MKSIFKDYEVIFFDLDDTLYPEIAYLTTAFKAIGKDFEKKYALNAAEVESFLTQTFEKEGRQKLFNKCFFHFFESKNGAYTEGSFFFKEFLSKALHILRTVQPTEKIALFPYVYALIPQLLSEKKQIFVVTNGNVSQQKNKIAHLDWQNLDTSLTFVFANEYAPKPSPKVFNDFLEPDFNLKNKKILFIGDATTDEQFSQNIGADFLHVDFLT